MSHSLRRLAAAVAVATIASAGGATLLHPTVVHAAGPYVVNDFGDSLDMNPGDNVCLTTSLTCTLRAAIQEANADAGPVTITIPAGTVTLATAAAGGDDITSGDLNITKDLTITGQGPASTTVDAAAIDRAFNVSDGGGGAVPNVTITGMTVKNGDNSPNLGTPGSGHGGCIYSAGNLTLTNVLVTKCNSAGDGGGVDADYGTIAADRLTVTVNQARVVGGGLKVGGAPTSAVFTNFTADTNTASSGGGADLDGASTFTGATFTNNTAVGDFGGGVEDDGGSTFTNVTITGNSAPNTTAANQGGGGLVDFSGGNTTTLLNATVDGNSVGAGATGANLAALGNPNTVFSVTNSIIAGGVGAADCDRAFTSGGSNINGDNSCGFAASGDLVNTDPKLNKLADNGGLTKTQLPKAGSPALDAVKNACPPPKADQIGTARPQGPACDIGAVEVVVTSPTSPTATPIPVPATGAAPLPGGSPVGWPVAVVVAGLGLAAVGLTRRRGSPPV